MCVTWGTATAIVEEFEIAGGNDGIEEINLVAAGIMVLLFEA